MLTGRGFEPAEPETVPPLERPYFGGEGSVRGLLNIAIRSAILTNSYYKNDTMLENIMFNEFQYLNYTN